MTKAEWGKFVAIGLNQLVNTLFMGYPDETLSARAYRKQMSSRRWRLVRMMLDVIVFWQDEHCLRACLTERYRQKHQQGYRSQVETTAR